MSLSDVYSDLFQSITETSDWYTKVFDDRVVSNWEEGFKRDEDEEFHPVFYTVINILRASAQGVIHYKNCDWEDRPNICDECAEKMRRNGAFIKDLRGNNSDMSESEFRKYLYSNEWVREYSYEEDNGFIDPCEHAKCICIPPDCRLEDYIDRPTISLDLIEKLRECVGKMMENEPIDWHPGSDRKVRDIIHPSLYCYIKDEGKEIGDLRWLPSEFNINSNDKVKCTSYINNLNEDKYPEFIPLVEQSIEEFLPSLSKVMRKDLSKVNNLQIITKVASIILKEGDKYGGGSWHIDGIPEEHIATTAIVYLDIKNITPSFLTFRKPVYLNEMEGDLNYPQSDSRYTTHHYGIEPGSHHEGEMNRLLGNIKCEENTTVVFPNALQHKVEGFSSTSTNSMRTILCFFVVDPDHKVISTKDIPKQQGIMSREDAEKYRRKLMEHRKYYVDIMNEVVYERSYSLCEH